MKTAAGVASIVLGLLATSALADPKPLSDAQLSQIVAGTHFVVIGEISDTNVEAGNPPDPLLVNAWGLSEAPAGGPLWVANNGTGTATLYNFANFSKIGLNVTIPGPGGAMGTPTGNVFTSLTGNSFDVTDGTNTGHSLFLFDAEDGTISGWAPSVALTTAFTAVDQSASGAVFKGLAIAGADTSLPLLYAADFVQNKVEVFNGSFAQIGSFTDPSLPPGYAPFNVQVLNGKLYVTFALRAGGIDEQDGAGLGFVDVFTLTGQKITTLISHGPLNAPWGLAIAPADFGQFKGALLVGNFGDGTINAFDPQTGKFLGELTARGNRPIPIDGLWALRTGPDGTIVFSSGPDSEHHGLVGVVAPFRGNATWSSQAHVMVGHH
jgi:uncharacterized protein (TIGR03118 family)